jgi:hypothetical protein
MAETNKTTEALLKEAESKLKKVEAEKKQLTQENTSLKSKLKDLEVLEAKNKDLEDALSTSKKVGVVTAPIPGTFKASYQDRNGKNIQKEVRFKNGRKNVVLHPIGKKASSACVMKLANGKQLTNQEIQDNPDLAVYSKDQAIELLTYYVSIGAGFLEEV